MVCSVFSVVVLLVCLWSPRYVLGQRPTASIEGPSPSLVTEGSSLPICVVLNMPPTSTATVFISTQDRPSQTAVGGEDYVVLQNAPLTFSPSDNRTCIDLQTQQDDIIENLEGLDVILTASTDITVDVSTLRVNIIDNSRVQVAFAPSEVTALEGSPAQVCAVIANGQIDRSVSIRFNVLNTGTATSFVDYVPLGADRTFVPNVGNGMQCTMITTSTDQLVESDEFFEVELTSLDSVTPPSQPARVTIRDDDGATVALQTPTDISTPEGNNGETMTVNLCIQLTNVMGGLQRDVVLNLSTVEVTAGPNDFEPLDNLMLTFPSSTSVGVNQCQSVTIVGDNIRENDEMFQVLVTPADSDDMVTGSSTFNITINSEPGDNIEDCGPLPNIQNGRVELNPNTLENSTASYFCDEGHDLIGDMSRTCQRQNATWSGNEPICRIRDCGQPSSPGPNGAVSVRETTFGSMANYSCNLGYRLVPENNARLCQANGAWSGMDPMCQLVDCNNLPDPTNGRVNHTAETTVGQTATYSCNTGYNLVGNSTRTCQATGVWSGSAPTCTIVDCNNLPNPDNGQVSHTAGTTFGQTATYSCITGYSLVGDSTRMCQATGVWSGSSPTCQRECGVLPNPTNGEVSQPNGTTVGQTATYSCNTGYNLVGNNTRVCQATGAWSGSAPTCTIVDCNNLPNPTNGQVNQTTGTTFGQTATYDCDAGYNLEGDSTRMCQATGMWSGSEPNCQIVDCGTLNATTNGDLSINETTFQQTAVYTCNTGYNLVGDSTRTCQATGVWSGNEPTCQIVDCDTLADPENGQVNLSAGTTFGQTATYSCNTGYNLEGDSTRMCQATGEWSGSEPNCTIVDCDTLTDPENGQVSHTTGTTFGQTATYSCNTGYNLEGENRTCQATGVWSGNEPTCQIVDCGTLINPTNGQVSHPNGTTVEQTATYDCDTGYNLEGDSTRMCQATGMWSGSAPVCEEVATGTPSTEQVAASLSTGAVAGIAVGGAVAVLIIVAVVVIIVILAIGARKKRIYRKYVLPYRSYVYANKRPPEENATNNEIRQWESEHPTHAVDAVDALAAAGSDD